MSPRRDRIAVGLAGGLAVLMPVLLLAGPVGRSVPPAPPQPAPAPLVERASPPLAAAFERPLFGPPQAAEDAALPGDAPTLIGIVGRLGEDAVALVRTADGTRALRIGESVDGWQLASLAIDAAFFTRGAQRVRVPLPVG